MSQHIGNSICKALVDHNVPINFGLSIGCLYAYDNYMEGKTTISDIVVPPIVGTIVGGCIGEFVGIAVCRQTLISTMKFQASAAIVVCLADCVATKYFGRKSFLTTN